MSRKSNVKEIYELVHNEGITPCIDLNEAEKKWKNIIKSEGFAYIIRKKLDKNNKVLEEWFVG